MIDLLVVEPSITVRKTLERVLETSGYTMRGVTRAADALGQVSRQRPDLILSEVSLPDGGGLELCQQFRLAGLPVLLMSPLPSDQLRRDSRDAGALELLSKPLSSENLLSRLAYHLKLPTPHTGVKPPTVPSLLGSLMTRPGVLGAALLGGDGELIEVIGRAIPDPLYRPFLAQSAAHSAPQEGPAIHNHVASAAFGTSSSDATLPEKLDGSGSGSEQGDSFGPTPPTQEHCLLCAQLEYPGYCLLLFRLAEPGTLVCLIQNSSYASLIKYHLRSSPFIRL